jgi:hypothetical protein
LVSSGDDSGVRCTSSDEAVKKSAGFNRQTGNRYQSFGGISFLHHQGYVTLPPCRLLQQSPLNTGTIYQTVHSVSDHNHNPKQHTVFYSAS